MSDWKSERKIEDISFLPFVSNTDCSFMNVINYSMNGFDVYLVAALGRRLELEIMFKVARNIWAPPSLSGRQEHRALFQ